MILRRALRAWNGIFENEGDLRALCLLRVFVGPVVVMHLWPFVQDMRAGLYYGDTFYDPWVSWYPEAPREVYWALLVAGLISALLMSLGLFSRLTMVTTFSFVAYNFFLSETHFRHNRNFLLIILAGLMLMPVGRMFSVDAWLARRRGRPLIPRAVLWPMWLMRLEHAATYFASGFSKLIDPDWWGGVVTWDRVVRYRGALDASPAPEWVKELVVREEFHQVFAKTNILTELFLCVALWTRTLRLPALWMAIVFHGTIEITARVQVFSWLALAGLLIWVTPETRERVLFVDRTRRAGRIVAGLVRALDWLARFRVEDDPPGQKHAVRVIDRGGRLLEGGAAVRLVLSRLPLLFFPLGPLRAFDVLRRRS